MKSLAVLAVIVFLSGCTSVEAPSEKVVAVKPTFAWTSEGPTRLDLNTVYESGNLDFFIVTLPFNGVSARFMVDSGSNVTWLTPEFAISHGAHLSSQQTLGHGIGGTRTYRTMRFDRIDMGFVTISSLSVVTGDFLTEMNKMLVAQNEARIVGILGLDLLTPFEADIDLGRSEIVFHRALTGR